jgi:hypothetical protein
MKHVIIRIIQRNGRTWEVLRENRLADENSPDPDGQATIWELVPDDEAPKWAAIRIINERFGAVDPIFLPMSLKSIIPWLPYDENHILCVINPRSWRECRTEPVGSSCPAREWQWVTTDAPANMLADAAMVDITGR